MSQYFYVALFRKDLFFSDKELLEIDPQILVIDAEPIKKLSRLHIVFLVSESYHIRSQLPQK